MADFNIKETEEKIREFWEKNKTYKFNINSKSKIYSIDTPPPTVSGAMHIGHAFSYAQQDFIARYKRMQGFNVFYPFGTDDNGLPTEKLIEKTKMIMAILERLGFKGELERAEKEKSSSSWQKISCPLGVVAIITELDPIIAWQASILALKSGNAVLIGSVEETLGTNQIFVSLLHIIEFQT